MWTGRQRNCKSSLLWQGCFLVGFSCARLTGLAVQVWRARCKTLNDEIVAVKLLDLENVNCSLVGHVFSGRLM